jgi:branched-chain amino acid transport system ATP-binding protein
VTGGASGDGRSLLRGDAITKRFGGVTALAGIDFEVRPGDLVGLIGPNGSGKTTLCNVLTGLFRPTEGRVTVQGQDVSGWAPHRIAGLGIGRTFQVPAPFAKATVLENLMVAAGPNRSESLRRARSLLAAHDLDRVADEPAESLDSGHLRLLEMARVMMRDPEVVLLDEPTSGVDPALLDRLLQHIRRMNEEGRAVCIVAHDMRAIEGLCRRVVVLDRGRVIAEGPFDEVRQDPTVVDAYLGTGA